MDENTPLGWLRSSVGDLTAVLRTSLVILLRHWPVLCTISLAGLAARAFVSDAAVRLSRVDSILGLLVFILIPITTLAALIVMMWTIRPSLTPPPAAPATAATSQEAAQATDAGQVPASVGSVRRMLNLIGSVLIPFLAVYASYGYLQDDRSAYLYAAWIADPTGPLAVPTRLTVTIVVVVLVAVGLRAGLHRWTGARNRPWLGIVGGYLEIVWIATAASLIGPLKASGVSWLDDRRVVHGGATAVDHFGQIGDPLHAVLAWFGGLLGSVDTVIVVPVAWLAVGAIVYGHEIDVESRIAKGSVMRAVTRRSIRLPKIVRPLISGIRSGAQDRFGPLVGAFRVLLRAGLPSMLVFCLLFLLTQTTGTWLFLLEKSLVGPHDLAHFWMPLSEPLSVVNDGIRTVLLVCLLGGAVDRVLRARAQRVGIETVTDGEPTSASALPAVPDPAGDEAATIQMAVIAG